MEKYCWSTKAGQVAGGWLDGVALIGWLVQLLLAALLVAVTLMHRPSECAVLLTADAQVLGLGQPDEGR
ncbi:hypothetical protein [Streptomyces sp. NBC_00212]|uniref:hypothetical protein n=1 Tax=Streptomyces sp. NBC_00212 TaxID=2975684 RepID=UPI002F91345E